MLKVLAFYLNKQKRFIPKKIWSVPCTMDSSFFSQQMLYCLATFLVYMALLSSLMQKHFQFKQRLNWVKRPAGAAAVAAGAEAPDFRLGGLIRPDPARHFYSTLSLLLLHTSQPNTSDAASLYKPPIQNGVESRYEVAIEFHVFLWSRKDLRR